MRRHTSVVVSMKDDNVKPLVYPACTEGQQFAVRPKATKPQSLKIMLTPSWLVRTVMRLDLGLGQCDQSAWLHEGKRHWWPHPATPPNPCTPTCIQCSAQNHWQCIYRLSMHDSVDKPYNTAPHPCLMLLSRKSCQLVSGKLGCSTTVSVRTLKMGQCSPVFSFFELKDQRRVEKTLVPH
jgi:hypothetical protein